MEGNCIRDLHNLLGGQLRFGPMPPLNGRLQTVGSIVPPNSDAKPHDVVLFASGTTAKGNRGTFLEEPFARGALGIVADRPVAPWPGRFSLEVEDTDEALRKWAMRSRWRFAGKLIITVDRRCPSPLASMFARFTGRDLSYANRQIDACRDAAGGLFWQLAALDRSSEIATVEFSDIPWQTDWVGISRPDAIVVAESMLSGEATGPSGWAPAMRQLLADAGRVSCVVLPGDNEGLLQLAKDAKVCVRTVGTGDDCDVRVVPGVDETYQCSIRHDAQSWSLMRHPAVRSEDVGAVLGVSRVCGWEPEQCEAARLAR